MTRLIQIKITGDDKGYTDSVNRIVQLTRRKEVRGMKSPDKLLKDRIAAIHYRNAFLNKKLSDLDRYIRITQYRRGGLTWKEIGKREEIGGDRARQLFQLAVRDVGKRLGILDRDVWGLDKLAIENVLSEIGKQ